MRDLRILVIDGNVADVRARIAAVVGYDTGAGYVRILQRLSPHAVCDVVCPADGDAALPAGVALDSYDGVVITGSALNIAEGGPAIDRQVELARAVFDAGVPMFGSCWGLQVAVTAAGGCVSANPRGREFGFARRILLTESGRGHPLYAGKPPVFEAPTVHRDCVSALPVSAIVLAENDMGLQAAAFRHRNGTFCGVQYHPEYDFLDIVGVATRYAASLIDSGTFADRAAFDAYVADLQSLHLHPRHPALVWKYGLGPGVTDEQVRQLEIDNWLRHDVHLRRAASCSVNRCRSDAHSQL